MKKIIIFLFLFIILSSCKTNNSSNNDIPTQEKSNIISKEEIPAEIDLKNTLIEEKKIKAESKINFQFITDIINQLEELNLTNNELEELYSQLNNFYKKVIYNKNNLNLCNKLENNITIENCKKEIFIKKGNSYGCNSLSNDFLKNECKIEILKKDALANLDENLCNKINNITTENVTFEINNCKNDIFFKKAIKNLNKNFCNKISNELLKNSCIETVDYKKTLQ